MEQASGNDRQTTAQIGDLLQQVRDLFASDLPAKLEEYRKEVAGYRSEVQKYHSEMLKLLNRVKSLEDEVGQIKTDIKTTRREMIDGDASARDFAVDRDNMVKANMEMQITRISSDILQNFNEKFNEIVDPLVKHLATITERQHGISRDNQRRDEERKAMRADTEMLKSRMSTIEGSTARLMLAFYGDKDDPGNPGMLQMMREQYQFIQGRKNIEALIFSPLSFRIYAVLLGLASGWAGWRFIFGG